MTEDAATQEITQIADAAMGKLRASKEQCRLQLKKVEKFANNPFIARLTHIIESADEYEKIGEATTFFELAMVSATQCESKNKQKIQEIHTTIRMIGEADSDDLWENSVLRVSSGHSDDQTSVKIFGEKKSFDDIEELIHFNNDIIGKFSKAINLLSAAIPSANASFSVLDEEGVEKLRMTLSCTYQNLFPMYSRQLECFMAFTNIHQTLANIYNGKRNKIDQEAGEHPYKKAAAALYVQKNSFLIGEYGKAIDIARNAIEHLTEGLQNSKILPAFEPHLRGCEESLYGTAITLYQASFSAALGKMAMLPIAPDQRTAAEIEDFNKIYLDTYNILRTIVSCYPDTFRGHPNAPYRVPDDMRAGVLQMLLGECNDVAEKYRRLEACFSQEGVHPKSEEIVEYARSMQAATFTFKEILYNYLARETRNKAAEGAYTEDQVRRYVGKYILGIPVPEESPDIDELIKDLQSSVAKNKSSSDVSATRLSRKKQANQKRNLKAKEKDSAKKRAEELKVRQERLAQKIAEANEPKEHTDYRRIFSENLAFSEEREESAMIESRRAFEDTRISPRDLRSMMLAAATSVSGIAGAAQKMSGNSTRQSMPSMIGWTTIRKLWINTAQSGTIAMHAKRNMPSTWKRSQIGLRL